MISDCFTIELSYMIRLLCMKESNFFNVASLGGCNYTSINYAPD